MRQVQLGLPGSVGGSADSVPNTPTGQTATHPANDGTIQPAKFPPGKGDGGPTVSEGETTGTPDVPGLPGLPNKPLIITQNRKSDEPATGINLSGCFEKWDISSDRTLNSAKIEFQGLTAQQVKQILQRIPSTFKASLEITFQDGGEA